jgi:hypothetical protein
MMMMKKKALESPQEVAIYQRCNILDLPSLPGLIAFIVVSYGIQATKVGAVYCTFDILLLLVDSPRLSSSSSSEE